MNDTTFQGNGKIAYVPVVVNTKMTKPSNADRIRSMTDEELAEMFTDVGVRTLRLHRMPVAEPVIEQAKEDWFDWLRQEASDG